MRNKEKEKKKEFLFSLNKKDFRLEFFHSKKKAGGQNLNKVASVVRIYHDASGAVAECQEERDQHQNRKKAFLKLIETPEFKKRHKIETAKRLGTLIDTEKHVNDQMNPRNIKTEIKINGLWTEVPYDFVMDDKKEEEE